MQAASSHLLSVLGMADGNKTSRKERPWLTPINQSSTCMCHVSRAILEQLRPHLEVALALGVRVAPLQKWPPPLAQPHLEEMCNELNAQSSIIRYKRHSLTLAKWLFERGAAADVRLTYLFGRTPTHHVAESKIGEYQQTLSAAFHWSCDVGASEDINSLKMRKVIPHRDVPEPLTREERKTELKRLRAHLYLRAAFTGIVP